MLRRPRRNRVTPSVRAMMQENKVTLDDLIYPLFLVDGKDVKEEVSSLPGNFRHSADQILFTIEASLSVGLHSFMMFPAVDEALKNPTGTYSYDPDNFYLKAAQRIKSEFPDITLISDVALDPYSSDGHDGIVKNGQILNDETLPVLASMAVAQAQAGFDIIGPSDMMDGRIKSIRDALDMEGWINTGIMSYTAKYASAFYGPFRDALDSAPKAGDKKTYQMNPANQREALIEAQLDTEEGADFLMVKPAIHYLDVIKLLRDHSNLPIAAYHVSGECAMLIAAAQKGWLDYEKAMPEALLAIKRAGADVIITYFALDFARQISMI